MDAREGRGVRGAEEEEGGCEECVFEVKPRRLLAALSKNQLSIQRNWRIFVFTQRNTL